MNRMSVILLLLMIASMSSCQASEKNKWTPPKFVKEWEIKEIKPGLLHHIISMTANKNGVFVLVKAVEHVKTPRKKLSEMNDAERRYSIDWMNKAFGRVLSDEERFAMKAPYSGGTKEEIIYAVQHYDFEGTLLNELTQRSLQMVRGQSKDTIEKITVHVHGRAAEIDSRYELIKPSILSSGKDGNLYLVDYEGNKILEFDAVGTALSLWKITERYPLGGYYDSLAYHRGLAASDKVYAVFQESVSSGAQLAEYSMDGKLTKKESVPLPSVSAKIGIIGTTLPIVKEAGSISDLAVDKQGSLYLFSDDAPSIIKLDKQWQKDKQFNTILKEGFVKPKPVYDHERKREIDYTEVIFRAAGSGSFLNFSSDKLSRIGNGPGLYHADKIKFSPDEELYVSFIGNKPFGVIDAMIFDKTGKMLGYWKNDKKSYADWFDKLSELQKLETIDIGLEIAFQGNSILIGRTLQEGTNSRKYHAVIQAFVRDGK